MRMRRLILLSLLMISGINFMHAIPAWRGKLQAVQPDGTTLTFYLHGDERAHYTLTEDGLPIMQDAKGAYRYITLTSQGKLTTEGAPLAHNPSLRNASEMQFVSTKAAKAPALKKITTGISTKGLTSRYQIGNFPTIGKGRCLVLMVEFIDKKFSLDKTYHERMLNETGFSEDGATGCAADYFKDQSMGMFEPTFDVVGPIALSHNTYYYGADDALSGKDVNVGKMISEACTTAHDQWGVDFSQYDGDGDGKVDMVYVIYAGYGQHAGGGDNTIWPHKYELSSLGISLSLDNKTIDTYACSSELFGNSGTVSSGIGTICHEFGHVLGLADHYSTTNSTQYQLGGYDIMDYGAYNNDGHTPPSYNAFERMSLGWLTPDTLNEKSTGLTLENIAQTNRAYSIGTNNKDEFYLLENRQRTGWDAYLPGSGLMITHVDYDESVWKANTVNNDANHPRFVLVPADGKWAYNTGTDNAQEAGDLYPTPFNNSFTSTSVPAAAPYTGEIFDKDVTNITLNNDVVSFDFMSNYVDTPTNLEAVEISDNGFTAKWQPVEGAQSYSLNLYKLERRSEQKIALREDFNLMTEGSDDSQSSSDISKDLNTYTKEKGWTGQRVYQAGGWCRIGNEAQGGTLTTPEMNMNTFDGEFSVVMMVKSAVGKTPVLSVTSNGQEGKTRITSTARTYLFRFTGGYARSRITFATNSERAFIDSVVIVRGDVGEWGKGAKEIAVTGTPEETGGEASANDFIHADSTAVNGISTTQYAFTGLESNHYYAFSVKAIGEASDSKYSPEVTVFTNKATSVVPLKVYNNAKEEIFTLDGQRVSKPLHRGLYIIRKGSSAIKKVLK